MHVLGVNAYHGDSSACLLRNGVLVAAAEEERFRRIKHWAGFPSEAIRYCLAEGGIGLADLDMVAVNQSGKANLWRKAAFAIAARPSPSLLLDRLRNRRKRAGVVEELLRTFPGEALRAEVRHVEHHLAHLASAFLVSPFDDAVAVSVDGFGDFASAAWGAGHGNRIGVDARVYFPHSLGIFYQAITQYLGFPNYGDEYKVMGLAPYGRPSFLREMRQIVELREDGGFRLDLAYFRHHREKVEYQWDAGAPRVGSLHAARLAQLLGPARTQDGELTERHKDIACSAQAMYEEALFHLLNRLHERYGLDDLVLAGGCAMNSVANGKVCRSTPFKRIYVPPGAGDAGGAIGTALVAGQSRGAGGPRFVMDHAYWGPGFTDQEMGDLLAQQAEALGRNNCSVRLIATEDELARRTAAAIAAGQVVGWFQGRMEWGPRALGNRSILADPRRSDMKDILNRKIKRRESFRPFAPSILREAVADWFECDEDVPFMSQVYPIREEQRSRIPAVTHVDGTGRLQTVRRDGNPRYYRLIAEFAELTGVPMVLNTSFNENEPVVCRPAEALDCFLRTEMDILVLGLWMVERNAKVGC